MSKHSWFTHLSVTVYTGNGCEADIVFLDDGWIQTVEVNQQHILVVEASFWIQHQSTCVCWFPLSRLSLCSARVCFHFITMVLYVMSRTFAIHLVWNNESTFIECMKQEIFIAFRPTACKRAWQYIATDIRDLCSKWQSVQFTCNSQSICGIKECWLKEAEKTAGVTEGWSHFLRLIHLTMFLENMWYQLYITDNKQKFIHHDNNVIDVMATIMWLIYVDSQTCSRITSLQLRRWREVNELYCTLSTNS